MNVADAQERAAGAAKNSSTISCRWRPDEY
jgi:hypothetical protein